VIESHTLSPEQKRSYAAHVRAKAGELLKPGDRFRVSKCPGTKRWATFAGFDGYWIVSKSGIDDYFPGHVDMVNSSPVDFSAGWSPISDEAGREPRGR